MTSLTTTLNEIEPALQQPTPRRIRPRKTFNFQTEVGERFNEKFSSFQPYLLCAAFLFPVLFGINLAFRLIVGLLEVLRHERRLVDNIPLIIATVGWNFIVLTGFSEGVVKRLINRWLVIHGNATVGRIRNVARARSSCLITYCFKDNGRFTAAGSVAVPLRLSDGIGKANDPIVILYSPANPQRNVVYRCSGYEVVSEAPSQGWRRLAASSERLLLSSLVIKAMAGLSL